MLTRRNAIFTSLRTGKLKRVELSVQGITDTIPVILELLMSDSVYQRAPQGKWKRSASTSSLGKTYTR